MHPQRMQCKLYNIYQMHYIMYLPDAVYNVSTRCSAVNIYHLQEITVSTPVDVCREDRNPPISQRGVDRQPQQAMGCE